MSKTVSALLFIVTSALLASSAWSAKTFDLEKHRGKIVYVDFWASWCTPCRASFPFMQEMVEKYGEDLVITAINLDKSREDAAQFLSAFNVNFDIVYDPDGDLAKEFKLKGMPTSYLYDRSGKLLGSHIGFKNKDAASLEQAITRAISQE